MAVATPSDSVYPSSSSRLTLNHRRVLAERGQIIHHDIKGHIVAMSPASGEKNDIASPPFLLPASVKKNLIPRSATEDATTASQLVSDKDQQEGSLMASDVAAPALLLYVTDWLAQRCDAKEPSEIQSYQHPFPTVEECCQE